MYTLFYIFGFKISSWKLENMHLQNVLITCLPLPVLIVFHLDLDYHEVLHVFSLKNFI